MSARDICIIYVIYLWFGIVFSALNIKALLTISQDGNNPFSNSVSFIAFVEFWVRISL